MAEKMKKMTRIGQMMKEKKLSMRDVAAYTGTQLTLVCYIVNEVAKFPTEEEFMRFCDLLQCKPTDIYPKRTLMVLYPKNAPKKPAKPRTNYGNPSVRVRAELVDTIKAYGEDVAPFVNEAVEAAIEEKFLIQQ